MLIRGRFSLACIRPFERWYRHALRMPVGRVGWQAARVSQRTAYSHLGDLVEVGDTKRIFTNPRHRLTEDYVTGRFG